MYRAAKFTAAIKRYLECPFDVLPWFASPITLTTDVCFEPGLAEL